MIISPHAAIVVDDDDEDDNDCRRGGGALCPPPLRSILSRRMPLVVGDVSDRGRRQRHKGIWGVGILVVEEDKVGAIALICQVPIHPGVNDGGKRSGLTLVKLRGSRCQAGEEGGGGAVP